MFKEAIHFIVSALVLVSSFVYIWKNIEGFDNKIFCKRNIIVFIISCIAAIVNYIFVNDFIRPITALFILITFSSSIMGKISNKSIIMAIYSQILIIISEIIFSLLLILILGANAENIINNYYGNMISNVTIAIIAIYISKIKYNKYIYQKLVSITDRINRYHLFLVTIVVVLIASFLTVFFYYKIRLVYLIIINLVVIIVYFIFIYHYLKANNNYLKVYDKYNMTLNSLKEYEDILSRYRISNHENKNQLLTIRAMVKNKKVASYIDEIIESKIKDNEKLMFESLIIPEGGLRGLIYSKMLLMKENNIDYELDIDKKVKTTTLAELPEDLVLNICNIVGVYLDNAIEAVKNIDNGYVIIEMYLDDTLNIAITNNYNESIDIDKMDDVGYSTKGGGHGYGLSLVKEIIDKNKDITNIRRITDEEFTQEIRIKIKK